MFFFFFSKNSFSFRSSHSLTHSLTHSITHFFLPLFTQVEQRVAAVATSALAVADHTLDRLLPPASYAEAAATGTTVDTTTKDEAAAAADADPAVANIPRSPSEQQQQQQPLGTETRKLLSQVRAVSTKARHRVTARASDRLQSLQTRSVEMLYALRAATINLVRVLV